MGKRKILCLFFSLFLLWLTVPTGAAENEVRVYVNEVEIAFPDQKPFINEDNRTLVPLRFVSEALGGKVFWDESTKTVEIKHSGETITLTIGENLVYKGTAEIILDTTAVIKGDRTIVPLRFVSECLGAHVYWNGNKRKVFITTNLPPVNEFTGIPFKPSDLPLVDGGITFELVRSNLPTAQIQYIDPSQLPIKLSQDYTIYSLSVDEKYIYIQQHCDARIPVPLYMVERGELNRGRRYTSDFQESTIFTYKYPVQSRLEQAVGEGPVNLEEIKGFTCHAIADEGFRMIVIANPLYRGEN